MCVACGEYNYAKRFQKADLRGRVALITGGRVKIGYQAAIMLLRSGAKLIVTTRFPQDAARRFASEVDFPEWQERLHVHGLDLRHTPSVEVFAQYLKDSHSQLDFVIHNACQTVRRPVGFYAHLMEAERTPPHALPEPVRKVLGADSCQLSRALAADARLVTHSAALSQLKLTAEDFNSGDHLFPAGQLDADQQQVDLRATNSWRLALHEISTVELLEVQLVNAIAPFVLNARLRPLMCRTQTRDKHIVNVSAMEGQFYRRFKTDKHPHTNMAKAALNMMTRTSAPDFLKDGIHMNSVDTGWVTDEDPAHIAQRKTAENGFHPPLDVVDGAARIVDPILVGITTGQHPWGLFLKDYRPTDW
jgi:NAD(P)-dependent dehydrogenase (short-subunit alcohol dehydrogenase family)